LTISTNAFVQFTHIMMDPQDALVIIPHQDVLIEKYIQEQSMEDKDNQWRLDVNALRDDNYGFHGINDHLTP